MGGANQALRGGPVLHLVVLALGVGFMLAYSRTFAAGFGGGLPFTHSADAAVVSQMCSVTRVLTISVLTVSAYVAGLRGAHGPAAERQREAGPDYRLADTLDVPRSAIIGLAIIALASSLALLLDAGWAANVVAAGIAGMLSGAAMLFYLAQLARLNARGIVVVSLGSLLAGGLLIGGMMRVPVAAPVLFLLAGTGMCLVCLLLEQSAQEGDDAGRQAPAPPAFCPAARQSASFPWLPALLFGGSGIVGTVLYGVAVALGWNAADAPNYPLFGVSVVMTVGVTSLLVAAGGPLLQLAWLPQFALLLLAMVLAAFSDASVNPTMLALLLASVFSYHFLRWMVFPALLAASNAPRVLAAGIILLASSSFLNVGTGQALAFTLPAGLQLQSGLVAVVAIGFAVVFAAAFLVEYIRHRMLVEEAPHVFEESLEEALNEVVGEAFDSAVAQAVQERRGEGEPDGGEGEDALERRCIMLAQEGALTPREAEVLALTARGHSSTYIAGQLVISANTVRFHQKNIYRKLQVHDRQSLLALVNAG